MATSSLHTDHVVYKHEGREFHGTLAYDDAVRGRRPGVLVAHAWMGQDAHARRRAVMLARLGYVALALDMYGEGKNAKDAQEAAGLSGALRRDRVQLRARAEAALKVLRAFRLVESRRLAAVGYCFGGLVALELARGGADVRGVVSFHGLLDAGSGPPPQKIDARVLALHGADDPLVPPEQVAAFQEEMNRAGADWQMVVYGGAVHAFTNPDAGSDKSSGKAYDERADQRSWRAMRSFFEEIFS